MHLTLIITLEARVLSNLFFLNKITNVNSQKNRMLFFMNVMLCKKTLAYYFTLAYIIQGKGLKSYSILASQHILTPIEIIILL